MLLFWFLDGLCVWKVEKYEVVDGEFTAVIFRCDYFPLRMDYFCFESTLVLVM